MLEAWRRSARADVGRHGHLGAGWHLATTLSVLCVSAAGLVWLRDYLTTGLLPMLPVLGNASAVTFVIATVGFPIAAVAWIAGWSAAARVAGALALVAWVLTAVVFQMMLGGTVYAGDPMVLPELQLLGWTLLACMAAFALWRPRTHGRLPLGLVLGALILLALTFTSAGAQAVGESGYLIQFGPRRWVPTFLRGSDTLQTCLLVAWALLAVAGVAIARIDTRPAAAALWLSPLVVLPQLHRAGTTGLVLGAVTVASVVALGATRGRYRPG